MEYIKDSFVVRLAAPFLRTFPGKDTDEFLHPYKNVEIYMFETYDCPFCGKTVQSFECNCEAFKHAFKKLQDSYGDVKHKSRFHRQDLRVFVSQPISELKVTKLTKQEILDLGPDVWDSASRYVDSLSNRSYLTSSAFIDGDNLCLLCKDLASKSVYRMEMKKPKSEPRKVYLGIYSTKTVSGGNPRKIGNYHMERYYKDLKGFQSWNEVCEALVNV